MLRFLCLASFLEFLAPFAIRALDDVDDRDPVEDVLGNLDVSGQSGNYSSDGFEDEGDLVCHTPLEL